MEPNCRNQVYVQVHDVPGGDGTATGNNSDGSPSRASINRGRSSRKNYGAINCDERYDAVDTLATRRNPESTGNSRSPRITPRPASAPLPTSRHVSDGEREVEFRYPNGDSAMTYGYVPGMNVEITQSDNDMPTQTLPEGLRHVMLHVIGSRPSEEVKFRRMKYRLESEISAQDTLPLPRVSKTHRPAPKLLRQQSRKSALATRQKSRDPSSSGLSRQVSRELSRDQSAQTIAPSVEETLPPGGDTTQTDQVDTETRLQTSSRQKGVLVVLALNELLTSMSLSVLAPFFPKEARKKGISEGISGWIFGVFALVQCIASPMFGKLLPRAGAKFLSQTGQFFAGGCTILFGMLQYMHTDNSGILFIVYCFVLRMFMAVGCASNGTASFAIAARTFPDNPATIFGLLETAVGFGLMMGPAIGGVLYEVGGFVAPFAAIGCAMVASVPVGLCILPKDDLAAYKPDASDTSVFEFLRIPAVSLTAMAAFIACLAWVMPDPTLEPHLSQFNLSATVIGLIFLLMSACYAICSPVWGWVADNVPDSSPMMVVGFLGTGVGFLILGPTPLFKLPPDFSPLWLNIIALIVIGLMVSLALVPTYDKILDAAEKAGVPDTLANCSTVAGIWNAAYCFGEFVGPVVAGWMTGKVGFGWTMTLASALCFFMAMAMLVLFIYESKFGPTGVSYYRSKHNITEPTSPETDERSPLLN